MAALSALPVGGLAHGLYVARVGGDYMHGRLLLPSLAPVRFVANLVEAPRNTLLSVPSDPVAARDRFCG